jgi:hypothetical protein
VAWQNKISGYSSEAPHIALMGEAVGKNDGAACTTRSTAVSLAVFVLGDIVLVDDLFIGETQSGLRGLHALNVRKV